MKRYRIVFEHAFAYRRMPLWWRPVHRVLWWLRLALPLNDTTDRIWRAYAERWP